MAVPLTNVKKFLHETEFYSRTKTNINKLNKVVIVLSSSDNLFVTLNPQNVLHIFLKIRWEMFVTLYVNTEIRKQANFNHYLIDDVDSILLNF